MAKYSQAVEALAAEFARMPGIGARTAERLAYHVQALSKEDVDRLADAVRAVKARSVTCSICRTVAEADPCAICADPRRDRSLVCVVERPRDLAAIESAGGFTGLYHVLGGHIAPLDGVYPENLAIDALVERVKKHGVKEVILATNPDTEGDATANYIADQLAPLGVTVSEPARGLPAGAQLEHATKNTLAGALQARRPVKGKGS